MLDGLITSWRRHRGLFTFQDRPLRTREERYRDGPNPWWLFPIRERVKGAPRRRRWERKKEVIGKWIRMRSTLNQNSFLIELECVQHGIIIHSSLRLNWMQNQYSCAYLIYARVLIKIKIKIEKKSRRRRLKKESPSPPSKFFNFLFLLVFASAWIHREVTPVIIWNIERLLVASSMLSPVLRKLISCLVKAYLLSCKRWSFRSWKVVSCLSKVRMAVKAAHR